MAQFLSVMSTRHRVSLVYLRAPTEAPLDDIFIERCERVEEVPRLWTGDSLAQRVVRSGRLIVSLIRSRPMWVTDWSSAAYVDRVRSIASAWQPDIIQIEYHVMGQYLAALHPSSAPRILTGYEPAALAAPYLKGIPTILSNMLHKLDKIAWQRFEPAVIRKVQAVVVFTQGDRDSLERYGVQTPIWRIPFGTMIQAQPLDPLGKQPLNLLFVGNFIHPPNIDAAFRLATQIFPPIQKYFPELDLYIVGDKPPPELKQISNSHIKITGRVPDLAPYLDRAAVFVAPLRSGGGMRVKVLHALSVGKAVVATPLAAEGLEVTDGNQISLAENDDEIVERIVQLLSNPDQRVSLAQRARAWAYDNLGWDKSIMEYERLYSSLLGKSAQ